jgi:exosortase/archaeosortase family protein
MTLLTRRSVLPESGRKAVRDDRARPFVFSPGPGTARFLLRFAILAAAIIVPLSLLPEQYFDPLNRITAAMVGELLLLSGLPVAVNGAVIRIQDFTARVIGECLALQPMALYAAFMLACPGRLPERGLALAGGLALLQVVNLLRIALVILLGAHTPRLFDLAHIYLGQMAMIAVVLGLALFWCRRRLAEREVSFVATAFLARYLVFASLLFLVWVPLNRPYMGLLDGTIQRIFVLAGYTLTLERSHAFYFETFGLVTFAALVLAAPGYAVVPKVRFLALGLPGLALVQLFYRLGKVWLTAFQIGWLAPVVQAAYHLCVYALPVIAAALLLARGHAAQPYWAGGRRPGVIAKRA